MELRTCEQIVGVREPVPSSRSRTPRSCVCARELCPCCLRHICYICALFACVSVLLRELTLVLHKVPIVSLSCSSTLHHRFHVACIMDSALVNNNIHRKLRGMAISASTYRENVTSEMTPQAGVASCLPNDEQREHATRKKPVSNCPTCVSGHARFATPKRLDGQPITHFSSANRRPSFCLTRC